MRVKEKGRQDIGRWLDLDEAVDKILATKGVRSYVGGCRYKLRTIAEAYTAETLLTMDEQKLREYVVNYLQSIFGGTFERAEELEDDFLKRYAAVVAKPDEEGVSYIFHHIMFREGGDS